MKKAVKAWLLTAAALVLAGCILFAVILAANQWDLALMSTKQYETNEYEITDEFENISIRTDTADIKFTVSDDGRCRVVCHEEENARHSVSVQNGILTAEVVDRRSPADYIGINTDSARITVHLPVREYASLLIRADTGDIEIPGEFRFLDADIALSTGDVDFCASVSGTARIKTSTGGIRIEHAPAGALVLSTATGHIRVSDLNCAGDVSIQVSTGSVEVTDVTCKTFHTTGSTGDVTLKNVVAAESISIERSTGAVRFDASDANRIHVQTSTGSVTGSLLTPKIFTAHSATGRVDVPPSAGQGQCQIRTDTGSIRISISN